MYQKYTYSVRKKQIPSGLEIQNNLILYTLSLTMCLNKLPEQNVLKVKL